jgi:LysM repeat protein
MIYKMRKNQMYWIMLIAALVVAAGWVVSNAPGFYPLQSALAAPEQQIPIYTPTPGPDGRIIWVVKANDTLLSISIISGIPVEEIMAANNMTNDTIFEGQQIVLGLGGPEEVTPTPGPTPTATAPLPTPTPRPGFGNICIILFNDLNGDSIRQENEPSIPDGAISVSNKIGSVSETIPTVIGLEPQCFEEQPEGEYTISVAVPEGYNPTTESSYELELNGGDETFVNFGAQANAETLADAQVLPAPEGGRSPILGIVGGLFLLAGAVVAIFAARLMRSR